VGPTFAALALLGGLVGLHWVTLRNKRRVLLDRDGRIAAGLPEEFHGVDVRDVGPLSRSLRELATSESECAAEMSSGGARTFPSASVAVAELLDANPPLAELLESDCSKDCVRYRRWMNGGRRGPKPVSGPGDGRFDPLNERLELKGHRRVSSWLEAVHVTVPPSKRWADFSGRLPALEEATGLRLNLPARAEALELGHEGAGACADRHDDQAAELLARARAGRLEGAASDEVPF
jgi:hypothetical protein